MIMNSCDEVQLCIKLKFICKIFLLCLSEKRAGSRVTANNLPSLRKRKGTVNSLEKCLLLFFFFLVGINYEMYVNRAFVAFCSTREKGTSAAICKGSSESCGSK